MGTFGTNAFANDTALDFLEGFKARKSLKQIEKAFTEFNAQKRDGEEAIAAAELVAAIAGHPHPALDPMLESWADKQRSKLSETLRSSASAAVESILTESELRSLWAETDELSEWIEEMNSLVDRVRRPPLGAQEQKPRRPPIVQIQSEGKALDESSFSLGGDLPNLDNPPRGIFNPSSVWFNLCQDIREDELMKLLSWVSKYPQLFLALCDSPRKVKRLTITAEMLTPFKDRKALILALDTLNSFKTLAEFKNLASLDLRFASASGLFSALKNLEILQNLSFYLPADSVFQSDFSALTSLSSLRSLSIIGMRNHGLSGSMPIGSQFSIPDLPPLPQSLVQFTVTCAAFGKIENLSTGTGLQIIDLAECSSTSKTLDVSMLEELKRFELMRVHGISYVKLPKGLLSLQIQEAAGLSAELPIEACSIRALRLDANALPLETLKQLDLRQLTLAGLRDYDSAEVVSKAINLVDLELHLAEGKLPSLENLSNLRFLALHLEDGVEAAVRGAATAPAIEELDICFPFDRETNVSLEHFEPLRRLSTLKRMNLYGVFPDLDLDTKVFELLGVKRNAWGGSTRKDVLAKLDNEFLIGNS